MFQAPSWLAPYIVTVILLTILPMPYLHLCDYYVTTNLCFLIPLPFSPMTFLNIKLIIFKAVELIIENPYSISFQLLGISIVSNVFGVIFKKLQETS